MHNRRKPYEKYKEDRHPRPRRGFSAIRAKLLSGRTQFAPTVGNFIIYLESAPQQTPPLPKGRGTVEDGGGILEFNDRQKPKNPPVTFGDSPL